MGCLGVHFALSEQDVDGLRAHDDEEDRLSFLTDQIERTYFQHHKAYVGQSDKAWDAIHRALADGRLTWDGGSYPLNHTVLAGEILYTGDDYIMSLKTPPQVRDVAAALERITLDDFRRRYFAIDKASYQGTLDEEDFQYTWSWFGNVRDLYRLAAKEGRYVLFTADQ